MDPPAIQNQARRPEILTLGLFPMPTPHRRALPHTPPAFVRAGAVYFITTGCAGRGRNQLALDPVWSIIQGAAAHYHAAGRWHVRLLLAMPDHVHALVSFPREEAMQRVVAAWKHYVARHARVTWQRDFFDHRLRTVKSVEEKGVYIRDNPVRQGLCAEREQWRYWWSPPDTVATPAE